MNGASHRSIAPRKTLACWGVRVPLQDAERAKEYMKQHKLFSETARAIKDASTITFALERKAAVLSFPLVRAEFPAITRKATFRESLAGILSAKEYDEAVKGFDLLGTIAIIEIPHGLEKKERAIAQALLQSNPSIKTVLKREGAHTGTFRTQRYPYLAGEQTTTTTYVEHGITYAFDVEKVYFSGRLSHDRKRIADMVKDNENVLVLFSGCAPYCLTIARHSGARSVVGIELNPHGHAAAVSNIARNRITNVTAILGDAKDARALAGTMRFDRILMPHPTDALSFIDAALSVAKPRCAIHYYDFSPEEGFYGIGRKLSDACEKRGWSCKVLEVVACGEYSPRVFRVCVDALVSKKQKTAQKARQRPSDAAKRAATPRQANTKKPAT